jgi:acyl-CoA thioesterase
MNNELTEEKKQAIKDRFAGSAFFNLLKLEIKELEKGKAVVSVKPRKELLQTGHILHGGVTATVCDTSVAVALVTLLDTNADIVTLDLKLNYLKPIVDEEVFACAEVIKCGKRIAVADVSLIDKKGQYYAAAISTYAIL